MNDKLKYIVVQLNDNESIFVFPQTIDHDRMFEAIQAVRVGSNRDWNRVYREGQAISAGFLVGGRCSGNSETLGLKSRGRQDTDLLSVGF